MRSIRRIAPAIALLLAPFASHATTILELIGTGVVCEYTLTGGCVQTHSGAIYGKVTFDVLAPGPAGFDSYIDGAGLYQYDLEGWVASSYEFWWAGGSFVPSQVPSQTSSNNFAEVVDAGTDSISLRAESTRFVETEDGYIYHQNFSDLYRTSGNGAWFTGLSLDETLGLAPGYNHSNFFDHYFELTYSTGEVRASSGINGYADWISAVVTIVPEPTTLALLGIGLAGIGLTRRFKKI